ncbi:unnamed protein product, partial [Dracunculus medinensis]|uniref:Glycoprotein endo-alpha-1,2-mannosidase n=1 Tax=Dracunculus medinensis TaxID=318479 RepID=A0A0N4U8S0_DRAME
SASISTEPFLDEQQFQGKDITTTSEHNRVIEKISNIKFQRITESSVHIFYYPWYGNPEFDKKFFHWNHAYLPHWDKVIAKKFIQGIHVPPEDIGSNFYPLLGPYSSRDPSVIEQHMKWISSANINVLVVSWYPQHLADVRGHPWDDIIPILLDMANKYSLKITFHMEPYKNRTATNLRRDIEYLLDFYGTHAAFYRYFRKNADGSLAVLPLFYFYDSYLIELTEWLKVTAKDGELSVRGTNYDILFIGLVVKSEDRYWLSDAGFDGMYTYFATEGFTFGSTATNWPSLNVFCRKKNLIFIPSVGPGYDDRRVRPWNSQNTRSRLNGHYYSKMFKMAYNSGADIISITSFNEWHEGTQIEPAIPFTDSNAEFTYNVYNRGPYQYLQLTANLVKQFFTVNS